VPDVFLSYKRSDEAIATRLVRAFEAEGLTVWWDRQIPGGSEWRREIEAALDEARCVVVLWSEASVGSEGNWVRDEAERGAQRGRLVQVRVNPVLPPLGFGQRQALDLIRWRGNRRDPAFVDLLSVVRATLTGETAPAPRAPRLRAVRRLLAGSAATLVVTLGSGLAANAFGVQDRVCGLALLQPGLSDACGALGIGDQPTRTERIAWEARAPGSCDALRDYLRDHPAGAYADAAKSLLAAARPDTADEWTALERPAESYTRLPATPFRTRAEAEADVRRRAVQEVSEQPLFCAPATELERLREVRQVRGEPDCRQDPRGGWSCSMTATFTCALEVRRVEARCATGSDAP
jgi:hypothetical protein